MIYFKAYEEAKKFRDIFLPGTWWKSKIHPDIRYVIQDISGIQGKDLARLRVYYEVYVHSSGVFLSTASNRAVTFNKLLIEEVIERV